MNQSIRKNIMQIFVQFIIALIVFSALAGIAAASTHSHQQNNASITQFHLLDASAQDRRLEGRMRASLAFDNKLSKLALHVTAQRSVLVIRGTVKSNRLVEEVQALALDLVSAEQIDMQIQVTPNQLMSTDNSGLSKLVEWFN